MKYVFAIALFIWPSFSLAAGISDATKLEIEDLFTHLEKSGCQFNRNGTWYSAKEASSHLRKKYDYLLKKDLITTAESFIEKAATESSMSGKAYEVNCNDQGVSPSSVWFRQELESYRKSRNS